MKHQEQADVIVVDGALLDTIEETKRKLKVGRTKVYELIEGGHLQVVKLGRNELLPVSRTPS